jgi:hypothetical protein
VQVPLGRPPVEVAQGPGPGDPRAEDVGYQPVQPVPPTARADGLHEEVEPGEFGQRDSAIVAAGHRLGEVSGDDVQNADSQPPGWALDQPQQALVHGELGDLVQVVQNEDDRGAVGVQRRGDFARQLLQVAVGHGARTAAARSPTTGISATATDVQ